LRLKTGIWVSAFLRRCMVEGIFGAVVKRGAEEAGAVYVIVDHLDGTCHLFGPAPGPSHDDEGERRWALELLPPSGPFDVRDVLERRKRFDPDIWIVEVEDRLGTAGLSASS
jgi:hypothetical protein